MVSCLLKKIRVLDTYAKLLYEAAKINEAMYWQEKAFQLEADNKSIQENLAKMECGTPTWLQGAAN